MNTPRRFVLHHSVAALWWLWHLPHAPDATQFLERIAADEVTVLAPAEIEFTVLSYLAADLGSVHFAPDLSAMLFHDVRTHFRLMESRGWLTTVSRERLAQTAFVIACFHAIELDDAMSVALAVIRGDPLVVADESVYQTLRLLAEERPGLHVQWLPDYGRGT